MNEEKILLSLIRKDCEVNGCIDEDRLAKMASLMNIHPDRYQKVIQTLIERGQIGKKGRNFFIV